MSSRTPGDANANKRLQQVLAAGQGRAKRSTTPRQKREKVDIPPKPEDPPPMPLRAERGSAYPYAPSDYRDLPTDTERRLLFIKGFTFGIPQAKLAEAFKMAEYAIQTQNITTVAWDGDKLGYAVDQHPAPMTFTFVISELAKRFPTLEFIFFKREGKARELISGVGTVELDEKVFKDNGAIQYLGPMPFMNDVNTTVVNSTEPIPPRQPGKHIGIEFAGDMKWWELGLKGLELAKSRFRNASVPYLVVGLGGAVKKELEKVAESYAAVGESKYPSGLRVGEQVAIVQVDR